MDTLYAAYDRAQQFYDTIQLFIPQSIIYTLQHFYAQSSRLLYTLLTSPQDLRNETPAILSTLALALSIYWTITSTIRAMRMTFSIGIFVLKYGTMVATILYLVGILYPDQNQGMGVLANTFALGSVGRAILSGWHALTQSNENQYTSTGAYRSSTRGTRTGRGDRSKPWKNKKFNSYSPPLSANTRSKTTTKKQQSNSRSKGSESNHHRPLQEGENVWWQESSSSIDTEGPLTSKIINWALERTWNHEGMLDWSDLGMELPESVRNSWNEFKVTFMGVSHEDLGADDAEHVSHVR